MTRMHEYSQRVVLVVSRSSEIRFQQNIIIRISYNLHDNGLPTRYNILYYNIYTNGSSLARSPEIKNDIHRTAANERIMTRYYVLIFSSTCMQQYNRKTSSIRTVVRVVRVLLGRDDFRKVCLVTH